MQDSALKISCFQQLSGIRANSIIFWPYLEKAKKQQPILPSKLHEKSVSMLLLSFFPKHVLGDKKNILFIRTICFFLLSKTCFTELVLSFTQI